MDSVVDMRYLNDPELVPLIETPIGNSGISFRLKDYEDVDTLVRKGIIKDELAKAIKSDTAIPKIVYVASLIFSGGDVIVTVAENRTRYRYARFKPEKNSKQKGSV